MPQSPNPSLTNHQSNPPYSESGGNDLTKLYPPISITPTQRVQQRKRKRKREELTEPDTHTPQDSYSNTTDDTPPHPTTGPPARRQSKPAA